MTDKPPVAIVGAGSIGAGFAIVHATAGRPVLLHDARPDAAEAAIGRIADTLADLDKHGLLDEPPGAILGRIGAVTELEAAVASASFVHECVSENPDLKRQVSKDIDEIAPGDAVIASATSADAVVRAS